MQKTIVPLIASLFAATMISGCKTTDHVYKDVSENLRIHEAHVSDDADPTWEGFVTTSYEQWDEESTQWLEVEKVDGQWVLTQAGETKKYRTGGFSRRISRGATVRPMSMPRTGGFN